MVNKADTRHCMLNPYRMCRFNCQARKNTVCVCTGVGVGANPVQRGSAVFPGSSSRRVCLGFQTDSPPG